MGDRVVVMSQPRVYDKEYMLVFDNGVLIKDFTINRYEHKNLIKIQIKDKFPGYHEGHPAGK